MQNQSSADFYLNILVLQRLYIVMYIFLSNNKYSYRSKDWLPSKTAYVTHNIIPTYSFLVAFRIYTVNDASRIDWRRDIIRNQR